jgi:hypothetical protein
MTNVEAKIYLLEFRAWRSALCPISTFLVSANSVEVESEGMYEAAALAVKVCGSVLI